MGKMREIIPAKGEMRSLVFCSAPINAWIKILKRMQVTMVATVSTFSGIHENVYIE